ncbi:MAG: pyridoxamine 5'-phosphate oxidase [Mycobacteriaceae bacterium]
MDGEHIRQAESAGNKKFAELDLAAMRVSYGSTGGDGGPGLEIDWLEQGWLSLAKLWITQARQAEVAEPNAMVLATVDAAGHPVTRTVLCKGIDSGGVYFFTNYDSDKGKQLAVAPCASVTFPWIAMERQLHIRGSVRRTSTKETLSYWSKRPRGSQLGAWASQQSLPIASRADLEEALWVVTLRFADQEKIPVPPNWGGYQLIPRVVEFWQGRDNRLHNRVRVTLDDTGAQESAEILQP